MKNIFLAICTLFAFTVSAQTTIPRTGTSVSVDNTYRKLNYKYVTPTTDAAGLDTVALSPNNYHTQVYLSSVLDSVAISMSIANAYVGDQVEIIVKNSSTGKAIRWAGGNIEPATQAAGSQGGAVYLTASKRAVICFHFDGAKWVEVSRMVQ